MRIKAVLPSLEEKEITIAPSSTGEYLKRKICSAFGIQPEHTGLLVDGKPLPEAKRLSSHGKFPERVIVDYLWSRFLLLWGRQGQERLRKSKVLLVGAGAIGNEAAKNLAMLGVGKLKIIDNDRVELSNISRMIFFNKKDVGLFKAEVLARKISEVFPETEADYFNLSLEQIPTRVFLESDLFLCGLDNVLSRIHLACQARRYSVPMIDSGIMGYEARVQAYVPPDDACPACIFPSANYAQLVGLKNPCDAPAEERKIPSLPTTTSLAASILTHEALKLIIGYKEFKETGRWREQTGAPNKGVLVIDLKFGRYSSLALKRNPECMVCGKNGIARDTAQRLKMSAADLKHDPSLFKKLLAKYSDTPVEMLIFQTTRKGSRLVRDGKELARSLKPGAVFHVMLKNKSEEYREVIVRIE